MFAPFCNIKLKSLDLNTGRRFVESSSFIKPAWKEKNSFWVKSEKKI